MHGSLHWVIYSTCVMGYHWFIRPTPACSQTGSPAVQSFLCCSQTHRKTRGQTTERAKTVAVGRIYVMHAMRPKITWSWTRHRNVNVILASGSSADRWSVPVSVGSVLADCQYRRVAFLCFSSWICWQHIYTVSMRECAVRKLLLREKGGNGRRGRG